MQNFENFKYNSIAMKLSVKSDGFARLDDIDERIDRLMQIVLAGGATTIVFLLGLITTLLMKG